MLNMLIAIMMDIYASTKSCATRRAKLLLLEPDSVMSPKERTFMDFSYGSSYPQLGSLHASRSSITKAAKNVRTLAAHDWSGGLIPSLPSRCHPLTFCASCMSQLLVACGQEKQRGLDMYESEEIIQVQELGTEAS